MPFLNQIEIEGGTLWLWKITESTEALCALAPDYAATDTFRSMTNAKRRREWLAVRLLMQHADCTPDQIAYDANGKPVVSHPCYRSVSISHSGRMAGLLLHPSPMAGLDIEDANRDFRRVETKYLSAGEMQLAAATPDGPGLFWCIKEAVYKAAGIPGLSFASQIAIATDSSGRITARLQTNPPVHFNLYPKKTGDQLLVCCIATPDSAGSSAAAENITR